MMNGYYGFLVLFFCAIYSFENNLLARGEHRIAVYDFGHKYPEVPMDIMEANYYNAHHEDFVIRIEDLNRTLNREINQDINREYNEWFNAEFNRRLSEYLYYNQVYGNQNDYQDYQDDQNDQDEK